MDTNAVPVLDGFSWVKREEREVIGSLIEKGAIFFVSHSGGKDSQAMYALILGLVPHDQICVVHADLGEVEWHGVQDHIRATIVHDLHVVRAGKTFFDMVMHRHRTRPGVAPWPSSATRQCTSDLKRGPIQKIIRSEMKSRGILLGVNCTGLRGEESASRAKKQTFKVNDALSAAGRQVWDWLPIHAMTTQEVFTTIANFGQEPHPAYKRNRRLSCVFCIMGCGNDLLHGAEMRPELYARYLEIEALTGYTMFNGFSLAQKVEAARAARDLLLAAA
ncbi:phosphoadenosine phosphosulfate reductase family protein [Paracoccus litorisediminis]|uniref:phosphoadenosine phosphosulfate reductase domain-containing protein n=1 Tax=Paracoccus litorisediminis TaxID=2006130 RepID=UPI00372E1E83